MHTGLIKVAAIHNLSLAVALGGPVFAKIALRPAVMKDVAPTERVKLMEDVWTKFNKVNVPAHLLFTGTWIIERKAIKRYFMNHHTNRLVHAKDILIAGALVTGVANVVAGEMLKRQLPVGTDLSKLTITYPARAATLARYVGFFKVMGPLNLVLIGASIAIGPRIAASMIAHSRKGLIARLFSK
jgi:uncharacterized membrane protein